MFNIDALKTNAKPADNKSNVKSFSADRRFIALHNIPNGEDIHLRLMLDADTNNKNGYYVSDSYHLLEVGTKDDGTIIRKMIPCTKNFGHDKCPMCKVANSFYNTDKDMYNKTLSTIS